MSARSTRRLDGDAVATGRGREGRQPELSKAGSTEGEGGSTEGGGGVVADECRQLSTMKFGARCRKTREREKGAAPK
eukprot:5264252-Pleurochrysis_carterae.AAC.1